MAQIKTGTFTGNGTRSISFNVGFEPDIVVANCANVDFETAGWRGIKNVVIVKNMIAYMSRHNNDTATTQLATVTDNLGGIYPAYGESTGNNYYEYGSYSDGVFTISNTNNNAITYFINNETYDWIAVKYT